MQGYGRLSVKTSIFSLRRLRWKLTLSYTLVTVVALLVLEILVVAVVVIFIYSSSALPQFLAGDIKDTLVPELESNFSRPEPDLEKMRQDLRSYIAGPGSENGGEEIEDGQENANVNFSPEDGQTFVLDDGGNLMVSVPEVDGLSEGERFEARGYDGLTPLIDRALEGEEDLGRLSGRGEGNLMHAVMPIKNGDRVVGVVTNSVQLPDIAAPLAWAIGVSVIALSIPAALLGTIFGFITAQGLTRRLKRLAEAAKSWGGGDFSVKTKDRSKDELGQLSRGLNQMAGELETLLQTRQELATLEARNRFARDLHDSVKQQVFATSLQIATARSLIEQNPEAAEEHLFQATDLVQGAQKELNVLIHEMRPAALEDKGLSAALGEYTAKWSERSEIPAEFHSRGEREILLETEQAIFRVAQEALANVTKHSEAEKAEVDLIYTAENLTLRVTDDGVGFAPERNPDEGFGLRSMRERLVKLGGHVNVESAPGRGTRVTCLCPLAKPSKEEKGERSWLPWTNR